MIKRYFILKIILLNLYFFLPHRALSSEYINYEEVIASIKVNHEESDMLYTILKTETNNILIPYEALTSFNIKENFLNPALTKINDNNYINLGLLKDVEYKLDEANLALEVNFPSNEIKAQYYYAQPELEAEGLSKEVASGSFLNYDLTFIHTSNTTFFTGLNEMTHFNDKGVFMNSFFIKRSVPKLLLVKKANEKKVDNELVRLRTTWTFDDIEGMARWRIGDGVTKAAEWSGSTRFGGIQYATNFSVRPDLILTPLVDFMDKAELPSTFDIYANNVSIYHGEAKKGEYNVLDLPVTTGRGEIIVKTQDITGKIKTLTLPYYVSPLLLKPKLTQFSFEMGGQRREYGLKSYKYKNFLTNYDYMRGMTNNWTTGFHFEFLKNQGATGIVNNIKIGNYGVISTGLSTNLPKLKNSKKAYVSYSYQSDRFNFNASYTRNGSNYYEVYSLAKAPSRKNFQTSIGYTKEPYGAIFISYLSYVIKSQKNLNNKIRTVTGSYEKKILKNGFFRFTTGTDLANRKKAVFYYLSCGANLGTKSISVNRSKQKGILLEELNIASYVNSPLGWGYKGRFIKNKARDYDIQIDKRGQRADAALYLFSSNKDKTVQFGLVGSLVRMDGDFFLSKSIFNSLALIKAGGVKNIPVYNNNRLVGYTNSQGKLLVPDVLSYVDSEIKLDPKKLPLDVAFSDVIVKTAPKWKSGVIIDFGVSQVKSVEMVLVDNNHKLIPFDEKVKIENLNEELLTGYEGKLFINNIGDLDILKGKICSFKENKCCSFNAPVAKDSKEPLIDLGEVICHY